MPPVKIIFVAMKCSGAAFLLLLAVCAQAQRVRTVVPHADVVLGNAFQVQYIITDPSTLTGIDPPPFDSLRLVSGPNSYRGNALVDGRLQPIENITYTLVPTRLGRQKIGGLTANFRNGAAQKSDEASIVVAPQPRASFNTVSNYTDVSLFAPASQTDLQTLIGNNLFVRTEVDRTRCFAGEPITVVFKLYSRLQSTSEVLNAPSLYGFSVMDLLDIHQSHPGVETINGAVFNTSVLRKMQLYPDRSGDLTIDPMQLQNDIEFSGNGQATKHINKTLASPAVVIHVRPLPAPPAGFTGAVGSFHIEAALQHPQISTSGQGKLVVTVIGKGNFIQLPQPAVQWPQGFEAFDPEVRDSINKDAVPTSGKRIYTFPFTSDSTGDHILPSIAFCYFDPAAGKYITDSTAPLRISVTVSKKQEAVAEKQGSRIPAAWWCLLLLPAGALLFFWRRRKPKTLQPILVADPPSLASRLHMLDTNTLTRQQACIEIEKIISEFCRNKQLSAVQLKEALAIRTECQLNAYAPAGRDNEIEALKQRAMVLVNSQ